MKQKKIFAIFYVMSFYPCSEIRKLLIGASNGNSLVHINPNFKVVYLSFRKLILMMKFKAIVSYRSHAMFLLLLGVFCEVCKKLSMLAILKEDLWKQPFFNSIK